MISAKFEPDNLSEPGNLIVSDITPINGSEISIACEVISNAFKDYKAGCIFSHAQKKDCFAPVPVKLSFCINEGSAPYTVRLSTDKHMQNALIFNCEKNELILNDLFTATKYYWTVSVKVQEVTKTSQVFSFKTAPSPRTIILDGVSNTRDLGGYMVSNGKRIKQGMVYRGANLDNITESGKQKALNCYKIKTELDLRETPLENPPLGQIANYIQASGVYYLNHDMSFNAEKNRELIAREIRAFANKDNYPIYFHCAIGRDRTGCLAFLLHSLLGVSERDMRIDYEISALSESANLDDSFDKTLQFFSDVIEYFINYGKGTLQENVEKFLLECGITSEEILTIRKILL